MYTPQILSAPLQPVEVGAGDPPQWIWEWGDAQVEVGIWECAPGVLHGPNPDIDEMMFMVSGRATITHDDGEFDLVPGTLWATPRHWPNRWDVHQTVRKLYVIDHRPGGPAPAAYMSNAFRAEVGDTKPRAAIEGDPHESTNTLWAHNGLEVGVWECTPGKFGARRDGYDEVFLCLSGRATLTDASGVRFDLSPGSALYTPAGFTGTWHVTETFRKVFCIINDRSSATAQ